MSPHRTLAIVGAGFSGTMVAANLLQAQHWAATKIVLIERSAGVARGKAYAAREYPYLLNVPAGRMSADSSSPFDFLSFVQHRIPAATAEDFVPRELYGQYLESKLAEAEGSAAPHVQFERLRGDVCDLEKLSSGSAYRLRFADGRMLDAHDVVLALGNPAPADFPGTEGLGSQYVADPWAQPLRFNQGETVLLIGTGLTMADVTLAASSSTRDRLVIHALSRHGLIAPCQTQFTQPVACKGDIASMLRAASFSALTLFRSARELAEDTVLRGGDWREAITFIRNIAPAIWQRLPARERRRLLRHVRAYWDVHRHRLPSETLTKLSSLMERGKLHTHAGRLLSFESADGRVRVTWRARGEHATRTLLVDRVVNCTGPDYNIQRSRDPLLRSLLSQGLAVSDSLNLGIRTGAYGALIDRDSRAANNLYYIGPMLRADHWEATAAHELGSHAERLASYLSAPVGRLQAASAPQTARA